MRSPRLQTVAALLLYLGTAVVLTWPMPVHLTSLIYGHGGDAFGAIGFLDEAIDSGVVPFLGGRLDSLGAPEGTAWPYPLSVAGWAGILPRWLLALGFGDVMGWNLWVLIGYVATGGATFLLVRKLTGSPIAGVIAGWAYAFYPFAAIRGGAHVDYMHGWPLVLVLWRALELRTAPTIRNGLWVGAALVLCVSFSPYFILFGGVLVATLALCDLALALREKNFGAHFKAWAVGLWMAPAVLIGYVLVNRTYETSQIRVNNPNELYVYAARLLDYLVPVPGTGFLGPENFAGQYAKGIASGERGLYLGWTVVALALVAFGLLVLRRLGREKAQLVAIVAIVGMVAALTSAPPTFQPGGVTIYMPSHFIYEVSEAWRVYARFAMVVMLAAVILAGFAIAWLLRDRRPPVVAGVTAVIAALLVVDLWHNPEPATIGFPNTRVHQALGKIRDDAIAAQYPLAPTAVPDYRAYVQQDTTRHRLVNGYEAGSFQERRAQWLTRLDEPSTAGRLAALGVRWVILNEGDPLPEAPPAGTPGRGFERVLHADGQTLLKVTAAPLPTLAYPGEGFGGAEGEFGSRTSWMTGADTGTIEVEARGCSKPCAGELRFEVASFHQPREMTVSGPGIKTFKVRVGSGAYQPVRIPLTVRTTRTSIRLDVTPGGQSPSKVTGQPDARILSVTVMEPEFRLSRD